MILRTLLLLLIAFPLTAQAQTSAQGQWSGDIITDAFRGTIDLEIVPAGAGWTAKISVKVRDKVASGAASILKLTSDSIRFTSSVGGADATYWGAIRGDSISGNLEATQEGKVLGHGVWLVRRGARVVAASQSSTSPVAIFDEMWTLIDKRYGNFPSKGIDWNMVKAIYRQDAMRVATDGELKALLLNVLALLNDPHISLRVSDTLYHPGGDPDRSAFIADSIVARRFVERPASAFEGKWQYAWMADSVGYLRIDGFERWLATRATIDTVLTYFRGAKGLVIDLRKHFGGDDQAANEVINRFATRKTLYLTRQTRSGDRHDQFLQPQPFYLEPSGSWQFLAPVTVLTTRRTVSAGENFILGMRELAQVTVIGDITAGGFADVGHFKLANGWEVNFPYNRMLDARGFSWEGLGLLPDMRVVPQGRDIDAGMDPVMDLAIKVVKAAYAH